MEAKASEAMLEIIKQIKNVIDYRTVRFEEGYGHKDDNSEYKMENEVDKITELQKIANGIIMMAEHVRDKMPDMNFVWGNDGIIYEEKVYLKKLKKECKNQ